MCCVAPREARPRERASRDALQPTFGWASSARICAHARARACEGTKGLQVSDPVRYPRAHALRKTTPHGDRLWSTVDRLVVGRWSFGSELVGRLSLRCCCGPILDRDSLYAGRAKRSVGLPFGSHRFAVGLTRDHASAPRIGLQQGGLQRPLSRRFRSLPQAPTVAFRWLRATAARRSETERFGVAESARRVVLPVSPLRRVRAAGAHRGSCAT